MITFPVLFVALLQDTGPDCVELLKDGKVHIHGKGGEEEMEMFKTRMASINEMVGIDAIVIITFRSKREKDLSG